MRGHSTVTDKVMRGKGYLLVSEAARKIGVSPQTIYLWLEAKKVEGFREGYRRFVRWSTVLRHLGPESCEVRGLKYEDVWVESGIDSAEVATHTSE